MPRIPWTMILLAGCAHAQSATPASPNAVPTPPTSVTVPDIFPSSHRNDTNKIGLVRGTLKQVDPIYNRLIIQTFGGGEVRVSFDGQTEFVGSAGHARIGSLPAGSTVSVDTVTENGKLFARSVRAGTFNSVEFNGQVVRYDQESSKLILNDPISPANLSLRLTPNTKITNQGRTSSVQDLAPGMLVKVSYSSEWNALREVEILAARGSTFTFAGKIVAVDLRSHVLSLENVSDQSLRDLVFGSLDSQTLRLLREGANVNIQAEFDGDHYDIRSVTPAPPQNHP